MESKPAETCRLQPVLFIGIDGADQEHEVYLIDRLLRPHGCRNAEKRRLLIQRLRSAKLLCRDRALLEAWAVLVQPQTQQISLLQQTIDSLDQRIEPQMQQLPDAELFTSLPGVGKVLAPRLLAAFGSQRSRYQNAEQLAAFSGIAPVTKQSGKTRRVCQRRACPKFLRQTFHEFADQARKWCPWSRAYYQLQRSRGLKHHAALRKLALRWIRILFRVWQTRTPYDPQRYLASIVAKNPEITRFLTPAAAPT